MAIKHNPRGGACPLCGHDLVARPVPGREDVAVCGSCAALLYRDGSGFRRPRLADLDAETKSPGWGAVKGVQDEVRRSGL